LLLLFLLFLLLCVLCRRRRYCAIVLLLSPFSPLTVRRRWPSCVRRRVRLCGRARS
jgi:hypothetical protein